MSFVKRIFTILLTVILEFLIFASFGTAIMVLFDIENDMSYPISFVIALVFLPIVWILSREIINIFFHAVFGTSLHQDKIERLEKKIEGNRKIMELESKLKAQESVKNLNKDFSKKINK